MPEFKNLSELKNCWIYLEKYDCYALLDVLYTEKAQVPEAQRLNIYVPAAYMNADGTVKRNAGPAEGGACCAHQADVPIVFANNSAGYHQMPCVGPDNPRFAGGPFLKAGYVYISCGNRGSESADKDGAPCGKSPANLIDIKTAIRFVRHNREYIPGNMDRMVSVGTSAGGAMSSLIGVTGNNAAYDEYLRENGAYMDERDDVFAAQIYCPIVDLDHADLAYEWMFSQDPECEDSHAGPAETMDDFRHALSAKLKERYIKYFNSLGLKSVETGTPLSFGPDGRSGSAYDYLMSKLEESASVYLQKLAAGSLPEKYSVKDYMAGNYTYQVFKMPQHIHVDMPGDEKSGWLSWDGSTAKIKDFDTYLLNHRRRMKPCTSFDVLPCNSGENLLFGNAAEPFVHFSPEIGDAISELAPEFPAEYEKYHSGFDKAAADEKLARMKYLINPMNYIGTAEKSDRAQHFRVNVGARDADTSFTISMALACRLSEVCDDVSWNLIWDKPHCDADYEGDFVRWIGEIIR